MSAEERIWDACEEAQLAGVSVEKFFSIVREAWPALLTEKAHQDARAIERMINVPWK